MSEIMHLFGKIGERNDLIKVLNRYKHKVAAQSIARLSDTEYKKLVPKLNSVIQDDNARFSETQQSINEVIKGLAEEYGILEVAMYILVQADLYAASLKGGGMGMNADDSNTVVSNKLREAMKLEVVSKYLEGKHVSKNPETRQ